MSDMLSALDQFKVSVRSLPWYTDEERLHLLDRAWSGDECARQEFVVSCLRFLLKWARTHVALAARIGTLDLVQNGCVALLEALDRAKDHPEPLAYLLDTMKWKMFGGRATEDASLIKTPYGATSFSFASLDEPLWDDGDESLADMLPAPDAALSASQDWTSLYASLECLPLDRRMLLTRRYGLQDEDPLSFADLARECSGQSFKSAVASLQSQEELALFQLKCFLSPEDELSGVPEQFYVCSEVMSLFGVSRGAVQDWVRTGKLRVYEVERNGNRRLVFDKIEVDAFCPRRTVPPASQKLPPVLCGLDQKELDRLLSHLPDDRCVLLARRYGLCGYAPMSRAQLAREMFPDLPPLQAQVILKSRERCALDRLQKMTSSLAEVA